MMMMMMAIDDDDDDGGDDDDAAGDDGRDPLRLCVCNAHRWSGTDPIACFGSHSSVSLLLSPRSLCSDVLGFQLCCVFMSVVLHF